MASNPVVEFLQRLRRCASLRAGDEKTDGLLLEAYIQGRDSLALEALVRRHGPMVWGVCRRTLVNHHDAEDAFQAAFLVLVRKAASIRSRDLLANWLYGVAHKTACKAKQMTARRCAREKQMVVMPEPQTEPHDPEFGPEQRALLDEELSRVPEKYRIAIVLCDLEGRSRPEVAKQLRLPEGTVGSRLARGRALLAKQLVRRGLTVSANSLAAVLTQQAASGSVRTLLLTNTVKIILLVTENVTAAGAISAQVSALTEGVLKTMALAKQKAAGIVLLLAALVLGGGMVAYHLVPGQPKQPEPPDVVNANADIEKYGSEADAKARAVQLIASRCRRDRAMHAGSPPRAPEAKLDREKRQWTVSGVVEFSRGTPFYEADWKLVYKYTPSGRPASQERVGIEWQCVSGGINGFDGRGLPLLDAYINPARYGWRPVGTKDSKGGGP